MPVPALWTDISDSAAANSPASSEIVGPNMNAYIQAAYAYCKQLYEGQLNPIAAMPMNGQKITGMADGVAAQDAATIHNLGAYLLLAGGTVAGATTFSAALTLNGAVSVTGGGSLSVISTATSALTVQSNTGAAGANIQLYDAASGTRKYIRCANNIFQVINGAYTIVSFSVDDSGNATAAANITAYSDERLKKDWSPLMIGFVDWLATVKNGSYSRIDMQGARQIGVGAQSLQKGMPESVVEINGKLTVAYGQAALAAAVELAREVIALRKRVEELELAK